MQLSGVVGSSLAARAISRTSLAELILTEQAPPQRVARLLTMSASKKSGRDLAFILLSGLMLDAGRDQTDGGTMSSTNLPAPHSHARPMTMWRK
jgi:hypothetical protein